MAIQFNSDLLVGVPNITFHTDYSERMYSNTRMNQVFLVGVTEKGPANQPVACHSWHDYLATFGGYVPSSVMYLTAYVLFNGYSMGENNIGMTVWISRVKASGATTASAVTQDGSGDTSCTESAKGHGEYGNRISRKWEVGTRSITANNPSTAPTLVVLAGTVAAATYEIAFADADASHTTLISPSASVTLPSTGSIKVVRPTGILPYGVDHIDVYVKISGNWRKAGSSDTRTAEYTITTLPGSGSSQAPASNTLVTPTRKLTIAYGGVTRVKDNIEFSSVGCQSLSAANPYIDIAYNDDNTTPIPGNFPVTSSSLSYLSGGYEDVSTITAADIVGEEDENGNKSGLYVFDDDSWGTGIMAAPGWTDQAVHIELQRQCDKYKRLGVVTTDAIYTLDDVKDYAASNVVNSQNMVMPFPDWRWLINPAADDTSVERYVLIPLEADFIGNMYRALINYGPFRSPAGNPFKLRLIPAPDHVRGTPGGLIKDANGADWLDADRATILGNNYGVLSVRNMPNSGPAFWDTVLRYSGSDGSAIRFIHEARTVHKLYYMLKELYERSSVMFTNINALNYGKKFMIIKHIAEFAMQQLFDEGAFLGVSGGSLSSSPTDSFSVQCDADNNPLQQLMQHIVRVDIKYFNQIHVRMLDIHVFPLNVGFDRLGE